MRLVALYKGRALGVFDFDSCEAFGMSSHSVFIGKLKRYGWNKWIRSLTEDCLELCSEKLVINVCY